MDQSGKCFARIGSEGSFYNSVGKGSVSAKLTNSSYHHGDLKQALVQAAREVLRKKGADALSLRAIAAHIGVSHMAPYAHFKSKKELLQTIAAAGFDELTERMLATKKENQSARGRNLATIYGIEYVQFAVENPELYRIMMSQVAPVDAHKKEADKEAVTNSASEEIRISSNKPFKLLHAAFANPRTRKKIAVARALGAWSTVHGMAALIIDGHLAVPEGMEVVDLFKAAVGRER